MRFTSLPLNGVDAIVKEISEGSHVVLHGLSGVGKTTRVIQAGRKLWLVFIECCAHGSRVRVNDNAFANMIKDLAKLNSKGALDGATLESRVLRQIASRMAVLLALKTCHQDMEPKQWMRFQWSAECASFIRIADYTFARLLSSATVQDWRSVIDELIVQLRRRGIERLAGAIDEAGAGFSHRELGRGWMGTSPVKKRSRGIAAHLFHAFNGAGMKVIVAGTERSLEGRFRLVSEAGKGVLYPSCPVQRLHPSSLSCLLCGITDSSVHVQKDFELIGSPARAVAALGVRVPVAYIAEWKADATLYQHSSGRGRIMGRAINNITNVAKTEKADRPRAFRELFGESVKHHVATVSKTIQASVGKESDNPLYQAARGKLCSPCFSSFCRGAENVSFALSFPVTFPARKLEALEKVVVLSSVMAGRYHSDAPSWMETFEMGLACMDDYGPDRATGQISVGAFRIRETFALEAARDALGKLGRTAGDALVNQVRKRIVEVLDTRMGSVHGSTSSIKGNLCEPLEAALLKSLEGKERDITYLETKLFQVVLGDADPALRRALEASWLASTPFKIACVGSAASYDDLPSQDCEDEIEWLGSSSNVNKLLLPSNLHRAGACLCHVGKSVLTQRAAPDMVMMIAGGEAKPAAKPRRQRRTRASARAASSSAAAASSSTTKRHLLLAGSKVYSSRLRKRTVDDQNRSTLRDNAYKKADGSGFAAGMEAKNSKWRKMLEDEKVEGLLRVHFVLPEPTRTQSFKWCEVNGATVTVNIDLKLFRSVWGQDFSEVVDLLEYLTGKDLGSDPVSTNSADSGSPKK